jgi:hypothetical protein
VCELGACRTATGLPSCSIIGGDGGIDGDGSGGGDRDSDTITDGADNCPDLANTNQANEDMDAFGDLCDPCPPFGAPADNLDSDGDGVGDGCDVATGAMDTLMLFDGFATAPAGVTMSPACWTFAGGDAIATGSPNASCDLLWPRMLTPGHTSYTISASTTLVADVGGAGTVRRVGVVDVADAVGAGGSACSYGIEANNAQSLTVVNSGGTTIGLASASSVIGTPTLIEDFRYENANEYSCSATPVSGIRIDAGALGSSPTPKVGIRTSRVNAVVRWIMIVSIP